MLLLLPSKLLASLAVFLLLLSDTVDDDPYYSDYERDLPMKNREDNYPTNQREEQQEKEPFHC